MEGEAGGVEAADEREGDVALSVDAEGFVAKLVLEFADDDGDLVEGAKDVVGSDGGLILRGNERHSGKSKENRLFHVESVPDFLDDTKKACEAGFTPNAEG